jgi:starvation-inducible DNA-binding protein
MTDLINKLEEVFNTNFVAYYRTHVAHVNIVGRNFYSDHKLLQKIYEALQGDVDTIAEFLRTLATVMPESLGTVIAGSQIDDSDVFGTADELLEGVLTDLTTLISLYRELEELAEEADEDQIGNFAQDRETVFTKFSWMLRATLEES